MGSLNYNLGINDGTIIRNYTYKDMKVDISTNTNNRDIQDNIDYAAVEGGIYNLFLFAQGERIINPEFGNTLYKYLYEPISDLTASKLGQEINIMFAKWEPRINVQSINIIPKPDENTYQIVILYTVPSLGGGAINTFNVSINARR